MLNAKRRTTNAKRKVLNFCLVTRSVLAVRRPLQGPTLFRIKIAPLVILLAVCLLLLTNVTPTLAAIIKYDLPTNRAPNLNAGGGPMLPSVLINALLTPILAIIGFFAVFYIVLAGWKFVRSNGDPKGAEEARARLTFAIVGLVIVILAIAMAQLVDKLILGGTGVF